MGSFKNSVADYANIVKSFIGCNYLSVAFAFRKAGLGLSIFLLIFIVFVTEHCCYLIVVVKRHLLKKLFSSMPEEENGMDSERLHEAKALINKKMQLGDIGEHAFGRVGRTFVTLALFITQFGFCVGYFIFIGNTLKEVFPVHNVTVHNQTLDLGTDYVEDDPPLASRSQMTSSAPSLYILVACPLPIFIGFSLLRSVRKLGFISIIANVSILIGCVVIFIYIVSGFTVSKDFKWVDWSTAPITVALLISSFEGIGTILPIEGSMVGNQHKFRKFLLGGISTVGILLITFGILGYLRYGDQTGQLLVQNIPDNSILSSIVDVTLIIGVIFTFPLQEMPVLAITETLLFTKGGLCHRENKMEQPLLEPGDQVNYGTEDSIVESEISEDTYEDNHADKYKIHAPNWLRCTVRILMVLIQLGVALLMKDKYAYVSALTGSLGSAFLAFIVPCASHAKLLWHEIPLIVKVKDITVVIVGIIAAVWSFASTLQGIINSEP